MYQVFFTAILKDCKTNETVKLFVSCVWLIEKNVHTEFQIFSKM